MFGTILFPLKAVIQLRCVFFSFFASGYYLNAISFVAASNSGLLILFFLTLLMFVLLK